MSVGVMKERLQTKTKEFKRLEVHYESINREPKIRGI
jgi:hypothetical protein